MDLVHLGPIRIDSSKLVLRIQVLGSTIGNYRGNRGRGLSPKLMSQRRILYQKTFEHSITNERFNLYPRVMVVQRSYSRILNLLQKNKHHNLPNSTIVGQVQEHMTYNKALVIVIGEFLGLYRKPRDLNRSIRQLLQWALVNTISIREQFQALRGMPLLDSYLKA